MADDTTPDVEVSDEAIEEKLVGLFADDDAPDTPEESPEDHEEPEDTDEPPKEEASDSEEVEFEGKAYTVPKEIKEALLRQSDYTKKTQEVASLRQQVEDKTLFLTAKEQLMNSASEDIVALRMLEAELERFNSVDWQQLHAADPGQAFAFNKRQSDLEKQIQARKAQLGQVAQQVHSMSAQHVDKQWAIAVAGVKQRLGKVTPEDDMAALQSAIDVGFSPQELKSKLADERLLMLAFKAAKWDSLQKAKPEVNKKAQDARPMKQVSRSAPQAQREGKAALARQTLKKTGDSNAAEAFFETMFRKK
jgi:hypothetical protein